MDRVIPGSTAHSHGAGVPIQTRNERLRSANPADHNPVTKTDEQWRYLDAEALAGLDTATLTNAIGSISVSGPAKVEQVTAADADFGRAGLPEASSVGILGTCRKFGTRQQGCHGVRAGERINVCPA